MRSDIQSPTMKKKLQVAFSISKKLKNHTKTHNQCENATSQGPTCLIKNHTTLIEIVNIAKKNSLTQKFFQIQCIEKPQSMYPRRLAMILTWKASSRRLRKFIILIQSRDNESLSFWFSQEDYENIMILIRYILYIGCGVGHSSKCWRMDIFFL